MSEANSSAAPNNSTSPQVLAGEFAVGTVLDNRFELLEFLGSGAVGQTYKANDVLLSRIVAIKILSETGSHDERTIERFKTEALVTTKLEHAGICKTYALKASSEGRLFMVMDFIEGRSLALMLSETRSLQLPQFYSLFEQIADALEYAHAQGVIHRDLKPGNIMVSNADGQLKPVIVDFGLVKWLENETSQKQTGTGILLGTSAYMSPEQCTGAKDIDARSDIYSLACVMFECLVGKPPFEGDSSLDVMYKHLNDSFGEIGQIKQVPSNLVPLLKKGLAKKRENRFQNMAELKLSLLDGASKLAKQSTKSFSLPLTVILLLLCAIAIGGFVYEKFRSVKAQEANELDVNIANRAHKRVELPDASTVELPPSLDKFRTLSAQYQILDVTGSQLRILYERWDKKQSRKQLTPDVIGMWAFAVVQFASLGDAEYMEKYARRVMESPDARVFAATVVEGYYMYYRAKGLYRECIDKMEELKKNELSKTLPVFVVQINADEMLCYIAMKNFKKAVELGAANEKIMRGKFVDFGHSGVVSRTQYILALFHLSRRDNAVALTQDFEKQISENLERNVYVPYLELAQELVRVHENALAQELFAKSMLLVSTAEDRYQVIMPYSGFLRATNRRKKAFELEKGLVETIPDKISKIEFLLLMRNDAKELDLSRELDSITQELLEEWKKVFSNPVQLSMANSVLFQQSIAARTSELKESKGTEAVVEFLDGWCKIVGTKTVFRKLVYVYLRERMAIESGDIKRAIEWIHEANDLLLHIDSAELMRMGLSKRQLLAQCKECEFQVYINEDLKAEAVAAQKDAINLLKVPSVVDAPALLLDQITLALYCNDASEDAAEKALINEIEKTFAEQPDAWKKLHLTGKQRYVQLKIMRREFTSALSASEKIIAELSRGDSPVPISVMVDYADVLSQNGKFKQAENVLSKALKEFPDSAPIWQYRVHASLAKYAKEQKHTAIELKEERESLTVAPPEVKLAAYVSLIQGLLDSGKVLEAQTELRSAEELEGKMLKSLANTRAKRLLLRLKKVVAEEAKLIDSSTGEPE